MVRSWDRRSRWIATGLYAVLVVALAHYHEMWRDEVRAFSVAIRNPTWSSLLFELQHEGHPILWYAILRIGYSLTHSRLVLPVTAIVIGIATAILILRRAPYPAWLRLLAVFGSFLVYDLTIVARNYGIGVFFMMCACMAFAHRTTRPFVLALCLVLMANTSVHAALAAIVIMGAWMFDLFDDERRDALLSLSGTAAIAVFFIGAVFAFWTAHPTPDMAWAFSASTLDFGKIFKTIVTDPGASLRGVDTDPGAVGQLPWRVLGTKIDFPRWIIDAAFAWLLFNFRRDRKALVLIIVSAVGFAILFRNVYSGSARHQGLLLFLLFAVGWISVIRARERGDEEAASRSYALGLLPLFALQALALPVIVNRYVRYGESNSRVYAEFIQSSPQYSDAILMSEPDYLMEPMPYYVSNRVYMPRQREFQHRVYFDQGMKRMKVMSLENIASIADSIACQYRVPVLLAFGDRDFEFNPSGHDEPSYRSLFYWTRPEWSKFRATSPLVARFPNATTDEFYRVFQVGCGR